jgi:hypothetical protein
MKKIILLAAVILTTASAYTQSFRLEAIPSVTIPVTAEKMTNLVFPEAIQAGVVVSTEIIAQKVHSVDNVIEIKALRRHFTSTNLTVYGKDGLLYSFVLRYVDDSSVLNFRVLPASGATIQLSGLPSNIPTLREDGKELEARPEKLHLAVHAERLILRLTGVYSKDSLEWLTFNLSNRSALDFLPERMRFYLQDRKKVRRRAIQEVDIQPIYQDLPASIDHEKRSPLAMAFNPFNISKGKRLICEFRGMDGRMIQLKLPGKRLHIFDPIPSHRTPSSAGRSRSSSFSSWPA